MEKFDYLFYLNLYPDLRKAGIETEKQALLHYLQYGQKENRVKNILEMKHRININENQIKNEHNDYIRIKKVEHKINILIRTSNRPEEFKKCIESIQNQEYKNYKIIVCYDKENSKNYIDKNIENFYIEIDSKEKFKYNLYCNHLMDKVNDGFILFLDDDDYLAHNKSLQILNDHIENDNTFLIWKYMRTDQLIYPRNFSLIKLGEIASCSFIFHSKFKDIRWGDKQYGDFLFVNSLFKKYKLKIKFIDYILTKINSNISIGNFGI